jgi:cytochrome c-type biogenesis protein CcsB
MEGFVLSLTYALLWAATLAYAVHAKAGKRWVGWVATGLTVSSCGLLTIGLVRRSLAAGHWPLTNRYEFALCFVWAILAVYLLIEVSWRERRGGTYVLVIALLVATYAITRPADARAIAPLLPALRSTWLQVHVLTTLVAYGAFGVAAGLGLMQLLHHMPAKENKSRSRDGLVGEDGQELAEEEPAPPAGVICAMERAVALGFPWLTLGILSGAIWAHLAWGRYWDWDPKETWALVTWLWYLTILHLSPLTGWRGRRLAGLALIGFGMVLFTFVGVPWLVRAVRLESLHGF